VEGRQRDRDDAQDREARGLALERRERDDEVGADDHRPADHQPELVDDARQTDAPANAVALGHHHPADDHERVGGHVARQQRLPPHGARPARLEVLAESLEDAAPRLHLDHEEQRHGPRRDREPTRLEAPVEVGQLAPLGRDEADQEAEDQHDDAVLDRGAGARPPGAERPDPGGGRAGTLEQRGSLGRRARPARAIATSALDLYLWSHLVRLYPWPSAS
jgi:hypothetical protein